MAADTFFGTYRGIVNDTTDPQGRGRVSVTVPSVAGGTSMWANVCRPLGSEPLSDLDMAACLGSSVWVMFEGGDVARPVVMGAL